MSKLKIFKENLILSLLLNIPDEYKIIGFGFIKIGEYYRLENYDMIRYDGSIPSFPTYRFKLK